MKIKQNIALSENGFVFDPSTGDSYTLNPTGVDIVKFIQAGLSPDQIREKVLEKYEIDAAGFDRFFVDFVSVLTQYQLLEDNES